MTQNDNGPGRNYGETALFTFGGKAFLWFLKTRPKSAKRLISIWEKGTFLMAQLFPVLARTWFTPRSECFGGAKNSVFGPPVFCYMTPNFVNN